MDINIGVGMAEKTFKVFFYTTTFGLDGETLRTTFDQLKGSLSQNGHLPHQDIEGDKDVKRCAQGKGQGKAYGEQEEGELDMGPDSSWWLVFVMHGRH